MNQQMIPFQCQHDQDQRIIFSKYVHQSILVLQLGDLRLQNLRTDSISISLSEGAGTNNGSSASSSHSPYSARSNASASSSIADVRSYTGSYNPSVDGKSSSSMKSKKSKTNSSSLRSNLMQHLGKKSPMITRKESLPADHDELVELVCRMQKSRFDDQRCDLKVTHESESASSTTATRGHRM